MAAKKRRTAAQKAATAKLVRMNKARAKGAKKGSKKSSKRSASKRTASSRRTGRKEIGKIPGYQKGKFYFAKGGKLYETDRNTKGGKKGRKVKTVGRRVGKWVCKRK